jgi:hypothetical protein
MVKIETHFISIGIGLEKKGVKAGLALYPEHRIMNQ